MKYYLTEENNVTLLDIHIEGLTFETAAKIIEFAKKETDSQSNLSVLDKECIKLLKTEGKLHTVKYYKDQTGLGLKESKEYIDALENKYQIKRDN